MIICLITYVFLHLFFRHVVDGEWSIRGFGIIWVEEFTTLVDVEAVNSSGSKMGVVVITGNPVSEVHEDSFLSGEIRVPAESY